MEQARPVQYRRDGASAGHSVPLLVSIARVASSLSPGWMLDAIPESVSRSDPVSHEDSWFVAVFGPAGPDPRFARSTYSVSVGFIGEF